MNDSIGARLREEREKRRLTLAQVSETTKIRAPYLQALENDDLSAMPSTAQARGFMRLYAEFLGLDLAELIPPAAPPPAPAEAQSPAEAPTPPPAEKAKSAAPSFLTGLRDRVIHRFSRSSNPDATNSDGDGTVEAAADGQVPPLSVPKQTPTDKKKVLGRS
jgi:transcriptional regulator with XRE-family HTH domain